MNSADAGISGDRPGTGRAAGPDRPGLGRRSVVGATFAAVTGGALGAGAVPWLPADRARATRDSPTDDTYQELLTRWTEVLIGGPVPDSHQVEYAEAVAAQDTVAQQYLNSIQSGDSRTTPWDDLPLGEGAGPSSNVTAVADRLRAIAVGYTTPASALYGDEAAAAAVAAGVGILEASTFHVGQTSYGNWWDWEIGTPKSIGDTCVLLGAALPTETLDAVLAAVDHFVPDPTRMLRDTLVSTGANRVDLCRAVAVRGALGGAAEKLTLASTSLVGVLDPTLIGDGFHPDGSFVMHTCVAYPGTYGQVLVQGMTELMRLLVGTEWEVAEAEREYTVQAVERSFAPLVHDGLMVDSVRGRAISRHHKRDADDGFLLTVDVLNLAEALPTDQAETAVRLRALAKGWLERNTYRRLAERQPAQIAVAAQVLADGEVPAGQGPWGHFAYPDMERLVHRRPGWTYSLALNSDRVARYEYMNGENAAGWHTGDGMSQLHLDVDRYQYTDEYWPTVDAKRLPGITVDTAPLPIGAGGDNDHQPLTGSRWSGMVVLEPGAAGEQVAGEPDAGDGLALAALELRGVNSPLRARTSWLFLGDAVLTAGSAIAASGGRQIETVVDNRNLHSPNQPRAGRLTVDGQPVPEALGETREHASARWAHLTGTGGYVFLTRAIGLRSRREDRTGRWRDLNTGGPTTEVTRRYLTLWHDHGTDPTAAHYAHLLLPGASFTATAARAGYPGVEVLELTGEVHAFRTTPGGLSGGRRLTAVTFFTAGSAAGLTADGPCAVLLEEDGATLRVAVSDPSRSAPVVSLELDPEHWPRRAAVLRGDPRLTVLDRGLGNGPRGGLRLLAETGGSHGATLTATLAAGQPTEAGRALLLRPTADATVRGGAHSGENAGESAVLTVRQAAESDHTHRAHLRFELPAGARQVRRAVLWVRGHVPNDPATREDDMLTGVVRAYGPSGTGWRESTLTWDSAPPPGPPLGEGRLTTYDDWTGLDVTAAVQQSGPGPLALVLAQQTAGHELRLNSREAPSDGPLLEVLS